MSDLYPARLVSELECQYVYQTDAAGLTMRRLGSSVVTVSDSLESLPGGFIVQGAEFEPQDILVYGTAREQIRLDVNPGRSIYSLFRTASHNYVITELAGSTATLVPEETVKADPARWITVRLAELASSMPEKSLRQYDLNYILQHPWK
jgi:hypothetical protein